MINTLRGTHEQQHVLLGVTNVQFLSNILIKTALQNDIPPSQDPKLSYKKRLEAVNLKKAYVHEAVTDT